jgi:peptidoglycan hydrolase-like protein with peptidoglycan-binding domain
MSEEDLASVNLNTMKGVQEALVKLGYDPGSVDGFDGPHTQKAVRAFQETAGIGADGIVGPHTRAKLSEALQALDHREGGGEPVGGDNQGGGDGGGPPPDGGDDVVHKD